MSESIETRIRAEMDPPPSYQVERWVSARGHVTFHTTLANTYLGERRDLKDKDLTALHEKVQGVLTRWREKEFKLRLARARGEAALGANEEAQAQQQALRDLLREALHRDLRPAWEAQFDRTPFRAFAFTEPEPVAPDPVVPSFWEWLLPSLKQKRFAEEESRQAAWQAQVEAREARRTKAQAEYDVARRAHQANQAARNQKVVRFREQVEAGDPDALMRYLRWALDGSPYPEAFEAERECSYEPASRTVLVDLRLPPQASVPDVLEYKERKNADPTPVRMKKKEHGELYDLAVKQAVLRTLHEVFAVLAPEHVEAAVVNGWVSDVDPATGRDRTTCIVSVSTPRAAFAELNLERVDATQCLKRLKGLVAGPLSQVAPVQPLLQLNREDDRFVASREVLPGYDASTNLAEIPWEDFEQLVRELFAKIFAGEGAEVRVTQASQDGGVDAVAFDPDPIRGGKFVIQAKRYTRVVPVSAVRDLYGTMINEGAARGLLVTTAHFGPDSRDFVKDKPITLIDGPNLVYLLEQHGHRVRIDVEAARAHRAVSRG